MKHLISIGLLTFSLSACHGTNSGYGNIEVIKATDPADNLPLLNKGVNGTEAEAEEQCNQDKLQACQGMPAGTQLKSRCYWHETHRSEDIQRKPVSWTKHDLYTCQST